VTPTLFAHGVGGRSDLPIPFGLALVAAALAVVVSFLALVVLWREPRVHGARAGRPLPSWLATTLDHGVFRWFLRLIGIAGTTLIALAAWGGPDDALNPTAGTVYVLFWVGLLAVASLLFGPVWRMLNPLRTLHLMICGAIGRDPQQSLVRASWRYPDRLGYWPGALWLLAFVWLELVAPNRDTTATLRSWFAAYAVITLLGAVTFGSRWFSNADGFEVYSTLIGRLSVLGRRDDGILVGRSPLAGLDAFPLRAGMAAVVIVLIGSTAYDGLTSWTPFIAWVQNLDVSSQMSGTLGLATAVASVAVVYVLACMLAGVLGRGERDSSIHPIRMPMVFASSMIPIAAGYALAHYYSLLVIVGQQTLGLLSDPLGTGANWFGTAEWGVSYSPVSPTLTATLQVLFVVAGHVVAVFAAHERAVSIFPRRTAILAQLPLLAAMVGFTIAALLLLMS